jgi:hypothetical protein
MLSVGLTHLFKAKSCYTEKRPGANSAHKIFGYCGKGNISYFRYAVLTERFVSPSPNISCPQNVMPHL